VNGIGIIILAAGESSRMNGSKQLLKIGGESLLRRSVTTALHLHCPTVTVLGANFQQHKREIGDLNTEIVFNLDWKKGMGNSLKFGLNHLHHNYPTLEGVVIMVCDQPYLNTEVLYKLIKYFEVGHDIVASSYRDTLGVPVLFGRDYFKELTKIPDEKGAKYLLKKYESYPVQFPEGATDIDTDEDWDAYQDG